MHEKKTKRRSVALAPSEVAQITRWADAHGLKFSEYVRMRALEDPIEREYA